MGALMMLVAIVGFAYILALWVDHFFRSLRFVKYMITYPKGDASMRDKNQDEEE